MRGYWKSLSNSFRNFSRSFSNEQESSSSGSIENFRLNAQGKTLQVNFKNGKQHELSYLWMRDHCLCSVCHNSQSYQREVDTKKIPKDIAPVKLHLGKDILTIDWQDNHTTSFPITWLEQVIEPRKFGNRITWDNKTLTKLPSITYKEICNSDTGLLKWLQSTYTYGFSLVEGVPTNIEKNKEFISKIGSFRSNHYGDFWDITFQTLEFSDSAYSKVELSPHTDGTYFLDPPGLQFFHMIVANCTGGETTLVDGFDIAKKMSVENPEAFQFLSTTAIPYRYKDKHREYIATHKVFNFDDEGNLIRFNFNNHDRAPVYFPIEKQKQFYQHIQYLLDQISAPSQKLELKLLPGTLLVTHNWRVMHGRKKFEGDRRMLGCYINQEEFLSKLKLLSSKSN